MKTEQEIKEQLTPKIKEKIIKLAEGFVLKNTGDVWYNDNVYFIDYITDWSFFPLLIHRAVEGWNKENENIREWIEIDKQQVSLYRHGVYRHEFKNYQPETLTACECAMLDCLGEVLK